MPTPVMRFTQRAIEDLEAPPSGFAEWQDSEERHLRLRISASGRRSWHYLAWQKGATRRRAIGTLEQVPLAIARATAARLDVEWSDTAGAELQRLAGTGRRRTLGDLWPEYLAACARLKPATVAEKRGHWDLHLSRWRDLAPKDVRRADVASLHAAIGATHQVTANRAVKTFRAFWRWAEDMGHVTSRNPAGRFPLFRETSRERFLSIEEAGRLLAAIRDPKTAPHMRHLVLLLLATGARRRNVLGMRWDQIDWSTASWRIPADEAKAGRALSVPLVPLALEVLAERRALVPADCPWVLPARAGGRSGHITEPKKGWRELLTRAGIADLHLHDLRRTLGSWMAIQGVSTAIIGKALGHSDPASTAIYARLSTDPVAAAMARAIDALQSVSSSGAPPPRP